jgi:small-conductance mechanosensitive channel
MNPSTEASSHRQGIAYVVSRLDWYWNLSGLLLDENLSKECMQGSRRGLERVITQLYAKLLLYQMRSVCYCHRNQFVTWMRDLIKLENWSGELSDIQTAERAVQRDSSQFNTIDIRNKLDDIAKTAVSQETKLDIINLAIRKQMAQQETFHERDADTSCIRHLRTTNPQKDKVRIEAYKGGLLEDSYSWVLDNAAFQQWHNNTCSQLLWIKGNPGKGKTIDGVQVRA